jgi:hypothetical protein
MPSTKRRRVGAYVNYRDATGKWRPAQIISAGAGVTLVLAFDRSPLHSLWAATPKVAATTATTGQMSPINAGVAVAEQTSHNQTNVYVVYRGN